MPPPVGRFQPQLAQPGANAAKHAAKHRGSEFALCLLLNVRFVRFVAESAQMAKILILARKTRSEKSKVCFSLRLFPHVCILCAFCVLFVCFLCAFFPLLCVLCWHHHGTSPIVAKWRLAPSSTMPDRYFRRAGQYAMLFSGAASKMLSLLSGRAGKVGITWERRRIDFNHLSRLAAWLLAVAAAA